MSSNQFIDDARVERVIDLRNKIVRNFSTLAHIKLITCQRGEMMAD